MAIHANSITAPKIDPAAVMSAAWSRYREHAASRSHLKCGFDRSYFAFILKCAWHGAKRALLATDVRRRLEIAEEIEGLSYKPFRFDTGAARARLAAELSALAA